MPGLVWSQLPEVLEPGAQVFTVANKVKREIFAQALSCDDIGMKKVSIISLDRKNWYSLTFRAFETIGYYSISLRSLYLWCDMSTNFIFNLSYLAVLP